MWVTKELNNSPASKLFILGLQHLIPSPFPPENNMIPPVKFSSTLAMNIDWSLLLKLHSVTNFFKVIKVDVSPATRVIVNQTQLCLSIFVTSYIPASLSHTFMTTSSLSEHYVSFHQQLSSNLRFMATSTNQKLNSVSSDDKNWWCQCTCFAITLISTARIRGPGTIFVGSYPPVSLVSRRLTPVSRCGIIPVCWLVVEGRTIQGPAR